jgi:hypothetical protein
MELINATRMTAGYNMGLEPSGRELLVVVIKGTFVIPKPGEQVRLADEQSPLIMADTFTGEPGFSAPVKEIDFAPRKHACDILLTGHARAPGAKPVTRMRAGIRVGPMEKVFDVVGDRVWQAGLTTITASSPQPFIEMPVSYDCAFGGADRYSDDPAEHDAYLPNPVGRGWHKHLKSAWVDGTPLPNVEAVGEGVSFPTDKRPPIALGPLGRGWPQRARFAGTYDDAWLADVFPFLPADFDERYYQAGPEDQQVPLPKGPIDVMLTGFTADGPRQFTLPHLEAPVHIFLRRGNHEELTARLDTIVIEPDVGTMTLTWRLTYPLRRDLFEISEILVGKKERAWWQIRGHHRFPVPLETVLTEPATVERR